jgi:hypothetical protein
MLPVIISLGLLLVALLVGLRAYDVALSRRQACQAQWKRLRELLLRRCDLAPHLGQFADAEWSSVLRAVIKELPATDDAAVAWAANDLMSQSVQAVLAMADERPAVRANMVFAQLRGELAELDGRLAAAAAEYNAKVAQYDEAVGKRPVCWVVKLMRMSPPVGFAPRPPEPPAEPTADKPAETALQRPVGQRR